MTKLPVWAAAIAATTLLATAAFATGGPAAGDQKGPGKRQWKPLPAFEAMDTNKDGGLTAAELKAGLADRPRMLNRLDQMFQRLDANGDGKVQKAELEAWKARRKQHHGGRRGPGQGN